MIAGSLLLASFAAPGTALLTTSKTLPSLPTVTETSAWETSIASTVCWKCTTVASPSTGTTEETVRPLRSVWARSYLSAR